MLLHRLLRFKKNVPLAQVLHKAKDSNKKQISFPTGLSLLHIVSGWRCQPKTWENMLLISPVSHIALHKYLWVFAKR